MKQHPRPNQTQKTQFIHNAMRELNRFGLVGIHDAGVTPSDLGLYRELLAAPDNEWTVRVYAMLECETRNSFCPSQAGWVTREDGMLSVRSVKLFAGKCAARQSGT